MHYNSCTRPNNHIPLIYLRFKNLKHQSTNSCTQPHIYISLIYSKFKNLKHQSTNNSINWLYTTSNSSIQSKHYIISQPTYIFNPFHRFKKEKKITNNIKALLTSTQSWKHALKWLKFLQKSSIKTTPMWQNGSARLQLVSPQNLFTNTRPLYVWFSTKIQPWRFNRKNLYASIYPSCIHHKKM